jgi:hypothetical protein
MKSLMKPSRDFVFNYTEFTDCLPYERHTFSTGDTLPIQDLLPQREFEVPSLPAGVYWGTSTLKISEMTVKLAPLLINEAPHH